LLNIRYALEVKKEVSMSRLQTIASKAAVLSLGVMTLAAGLALTPAASIQAITPISTPPSVPPTTPSKNAPLFTTESLPDGLARQPYSATVSGLDRDMVEYVTVTQTGLPSGLSIQNCQSSFVPFAAKTMFSCEIAGTPVRRGTYNVVLTAQDLQGNRTDKNFTLIVRTMVN
jgi:hypothetical protein